ncbi:phosphatidic acid phosphatase [Synechococcus sp. PCC 7336]|uniref:phosphatidic acid phosphatase n=1 Tax=Synechococcus sp. PCC 7336 TaxID=195250 RepID=UPI000349DF0D|nr:phosphatidic acid phosphatase [Synechococcus sp. PCC 7336]
MANSQQGNSGKQNFNVRRKDARAIRNDVEREAFDAFETTPPETNGDEARFDSLDLPGFASFTKALSHNSEDGLVDPASFTSLLDAIEAETQAAFEDVQLGGGVRLLANPLNTYSFQLIGNDSNGARMAAAPAFDSRNTAVDMVERYWMALSRDVPFDQYTTSPLIAEACADLNNLGFEQEFGFVCTPDNIFRGPYEGCDVGPHVSQFLLQDFDFGNQPIRQLQRYPQEGLDFMTDFETWLAVNNGDVDPTGDDVLVGTRYIITLRDAGQWVHIDFPHQSSLWATIILLGKAAAISAASPYASGAITTSDAFGSLGGPDITIQSGFAAVYGLKHAWFQKWGVHRRLRPEVYGQRLELFRRGILGQPFDARFNELFGAGADVWQTTTVLERILEHNKAQNVTFNRGDTDGTWLLPMGFPEGSPTHPSYPGGHSAFIAAGATIAKAFFADGVISDPVVPTADGQGLVPFNGPPLTVHGELNKLIANVTLFRDGAGMHWRTDGTTAGNPGTAIATGGNLLGENMAVSMLRDVKVTYREEVGPFQFDSITGAPIQV